MATARTNRTAKTSAELKVELENLRKKLVELEKRAFAEELGELVLNSNITAAYKEIKAKAKDVSDTAILSAIATSIGLKGIQITQTPAKKRAPSTTPRKPRTKKV